MNRKLVIDYEVQDALDIIVRYAVEQYESDQTHHVHLREYSEYVLGEQRRAAVNALLGLAHDVLHGGLDPADNPWCHVIAEQAAMYLRWARQQTVLVRDERKRGRAPF